MARVANDAVKDTNKLYAKSHAIIVNIITQGQIVQIHLTRKKFLTEMSHETIVWKVVATIQSRKHERQKKFIVFFK